MKMSRVRELIPAYEVKLLLLKFFMKFFLKKLLELQ